MWVEKDTVSITTAADGSATAYSRPFRGRITTIKYNKTDFDNTADFTITVEDTGENVWVQSNVTASASVLPAQFTNDPDTGAEATGTVKDIHVAGSRIKIVIAQGGNVKTGAFVIEGEGVFAPS